MRFKTRVCIGTVAVCILASAAHAQAGGKPLHASKILNEIRAHGAEETTTALRNAGGRWDAVLSHIARGNLAWLEVARALYTGTDGGASEALDDAVFLALKPSPVAVLRMLKARQFETAFVCSSNVGVDRTTATTERLIQARIEALDGVTNEAIRSARNQCLAGLRAALHDLRSEK